MDTNRTRRPVPTAFARQVPPYDPGMDDEIELRLSANEGPVPDAFRTLTVSLGDGDVLRRYPKLAGFERRLAEEVGVAPERLLVTAGADDGIDRLCRGYLAADRNLVLPTPTFEMFERGALLVGAEVRSIPWVEGDFPERELLDRVDSDTGVIALVSPSNPGGRAVPLEVIRRIAETAPETLLVVDAAYEEFADRPVTGLLQDLPNVVVLRTLSKVWSLAGARVGYTVADPEVIDVLRRIAPPYTVSGLSLAYASAVLDRPDVRADYQRRVRHERAALVDLLADLGIPAERSQTNFVFFRTPEAARLRDGLGALGIGVRSWRADPELSDALRIGCPGSEDDFERLCTALRTVLRPEAVLLDMDGVLADVSRSYREAIRLTATAFGVTLTLEDIGRAKQGFAVNNDWKLTRQLLADRGIHVPLDEVTRRFEAFYQGEAGRPGLREEETLLCSSEWLRGLSRRLPVAVVTGRPREDARRFLDRFDLTDAVQALVCMEDAPAKPDPAPVRLALDQLGVTCAWMCGDTADDLHAARAAGVLPIGVGTGSTLLEVGAFRVVECVEQLDELMRGAPTS